MTKFILAVLLYSMMSGQTVYHGVSTCIQFNSPKKCTDTRSQMIQDFAEDENKKLYVSLCVPFEVTEDFTPENTVEACKEAMNRGLKTYGKLPVDFMR